MSPRLQAFLSRSGAAPSRRKAEALIVAGRVTVNGGTASLGESVDLDSDTVLLDGNSVKLPSQHTHLALNKPAGYLTTLSDDRGRHTVAEIMPPTPGLVPAGRLDCETTGLLILTTNGDLVNRLTHPSFEMEKEYTLTIDGFAPDESLQSLSEGPSLEDGRMSPPEISDPRRSPQQTTLHLTLHEGRKRIIRRACEAVGLRLLSLHRVRIGPVSLGDLPEGGYRSLTPEELEELGRP